MFARPKVRLHPKPALSPAFYRKTMRDNSEAKSITDVVRAVVISPTAELVEASGVDKLLAQIRPEWQARRLIQRVIKILPHDPSSACQRLLNAAIHDLREKIALAGIDIAAEVARQFRLPPVTKPEDLEEGYSTTHMLELAYRMGLLSRIEYRKLLRAYDIRRDLEHEDDEYEAGVEDCVYIFKTCVEAVLAKDPVQVLRITDIKEIVEQPVPAAIEEAVLDDYASAPVPRQLEIYRFLVSGALNAKYADIVRQNCYTVLSVVRDRTQSQVILDAAREYGERLGRKAPDLLLARVAYAAGILPYLKKAHLRGFYKTLVDEMCKVGFTFRSHSEHGQLLRNFEEVGGLQYCPDDVLDQAAEWLVLCYVGEPGGYGRGHSRPVFYSNVGAPLALELLKASAKRITPVLEKLRSTSKRIKDECADKHVARRFESILDAMQGDGE
jgi:hypothetical protein